MIPHRRLIITKRGFIGLAVAHVEVGTDACILLGCSIPVLLEKYNNHYHLKSSCYMQGWKIGGILDEMGGSDEEIFKTGKAAANLNTVACTHYLTHRFGLILWFQNGIHTRVKFYSPVDPLVVTANHDDSGLIRVITYCSAARMIFGFDCSSSLSG